MVRADGVVTRSGGKVVKNVAGYDLGKLYTGSYGTLGLITEAAFRLHPRPAATAFVTLDCAEPAAAQSLLAAAVDSPLAPAAAELDRPDRGAPLRTGILLEGDRDGVAERAERMRSLLGDGAEISAQPPPWWGRGCGGQRRAGRWSGSRSGPVSWLRCWRPPTRPRRRRAWTRRSAAPRRRACSTWRAGADDSPAAVARFVGALRAALAASRGDGGGPRPAPWSLHAPAEVRAAVDLWGPVPSARPDAVGEGSVRP